MNKGLTGSTGDSDANGLVAHNDFKSDFRSIETRALTVQARIAAQLSLPLPLKLAGRGLK